MMLRYGVLFGSLVFGLFAACDRDAPPPVTFAPSGEGYASKMDFARLEHELPLSSADVMKITPANLAAATQEQVDQIYARLTAGPIPDGPYEGQMFFPTGSSQRARVSEIVGGLKGRLVHFKTAKLEHLGEIAWKGKVFYKKDRVLRNRINDLAVLKPLLGEDIGSIKNST